LVYIDDLIVVGDDEHEKQTLREKLVVQFERNDLVELKYFHGIKTTYLKKGIFIS